MLKPQFALEQRIDESQETILNELKSGPYELIHDPDVMEIWKSGCSLHLMDSSHYQATGYIRKSSKYFSYFSYFLVRK
jgi:hypothetical protein